MTNPFLTVVDALNSGGVEYAIVGGFAVVMHGSNRFTPDVDIIVNLEGTNPERAVDALLRSNLEPSGGVGPAEFSNAEARQRWVTEGKYFLSFYDCQVPTFRVDLLNNPPVSFKDLAAGLAHISVSAIDVPLCGFDDLLRMKELAGRGQDRMDVANLKLAREIQLAAGDRATLDQLLDNPPQDFERERIEDLIQFSHFSGEEKLDWLLEMLTKLGRFCLLDG